MSKRSIASGGTSDETAARSVDSDTSAVFDTVCKKVESADSEDELMEEMQSLSGNSFDPYSGKYIKRKLQRDMEITFSLLMSVVKRIFFAFVTWHSALSMTSGMLTERMMLENRARELWKLQLYLSRLAFNTQEYPDNDILHLA